MVSEDMSYFDLFISMIVRGLLLGAVFGMIYGTVLVPVIGTLFGLFYGSVVGLFLGLGNGLLLVMITFAFVRLQRNSHYMQISTLCCTLFSIMAGMYAFALITGQRQFSSNAWSWYTMMTSIPALIAGLLTGWVTQGLTFPLEKRKRKPKVKMSQDTRIDPRREEQYTTLAQVLAQKHSNQ